jgi:uncharacterized protein YbaP (TraB family)
MSNFGAFSKGVVMLTRRLMSLILLLAWLIPVTAAAADVGLLWKLQAPSGKISHLFGTIHADDGRIIDFSPKLVKALQESDTYYVEVMPGGDTSAFNMKDGRKLSSLLTPEEYDRVCELADAYVMHREQANHMKPWLLAIALDPPKPSSIFTQDVLLAGLARDKLKPVKALSSRNDHFETLDSLSMEEQLTMLRSVLKRSQEEKEKDFEELLAAYLSGNLDKIAGVDEKMTEGLLPAAIWERIRTKLLDERNASMAETLADALNKESAFVAVGASHLAGKGGLLQRLRDAGFQISAVE